MTVDLARRLLRSGSVPVAVVEAALVESVRTRVSFVRAVLTRGRRIATAVEGELSKSTSEVLRGPVADRALARRLPPTLCERLLVVPTALDETGAVLVAAVDPSDRDALREVSYHLEAPVHAFRASFSELMEALAQVREGLIADAEYEDRTPPLGTRAVVSRPRAPALSLTPPPPESNEREAAVSWIPPPGGDGVDAALSDLAPESTPIPLVRVAPEGRVGMPTQQAPAGRNPVPTPHPDGAVRGPAKRRETRPGVGTGRRKLTPLADEAGEPVISLVRSKPHRDAEHRSTQSASVAPAKPASPSPEPTPAQPAFAPEPAGELPADAPRSRRSVTPTDPEARAERLAALLGQLDHAKSAQDIIDTLLRASEIAEAKGVIFAVRRGRLVARAATVGIAVAGLELPIPRAGVFAEALKRGIAWARLAGQPEANALRQAWGASDEVTALRIAVGNRPVLLWVLSMIPGGARREVEVLAERSAEQLELLILDQKLQ